MLLAHWSVVLFDKKVVGKGGLADQGVVNLIHNRSLGLLGVLVRREHRLGQLVHAQELLVLALSQQLDRLAIVPLLPLEDSHYPLVACEGLRKEVQLVVLKAWVVVSYGVETLRFSRRCVDVPCPVVRQSVH